MSNTVIRVENLSKLYRLGEVGTGSLAHDVNRWWHKVRGKEDPYLKVGQVNDRTKKAGSSSQSTVGSSQREKESRQSTVDSRQEEKGEESNQLAVGSWQEEKGEESGQLAVGSRQQATEDCQLKTENSAEGGSDYVFALKNVSFDVQQGEVLGIIGRNGAGKSTLLKILSRVTVQTTGRIRVKGRIASLLEVGTGFHPELTGRENVYLNGAILGMRKAEIKAKFDEIVDFSGCERYIDTPVKRYSSGMYVRLAFAVAAHLEPEILIVDEVLAVGDAEFQKKCLGKMKDVAGHGRTVLFVSHNMAAVKALCSRVVYLSNGEIIAQGSTNEIVSSYLNAGRDSACEREWPDPKTAPGNENIRMESIRVIPPEKEPEITIDSGAQIEITFFNSLAGINLDCTVYVLNNDGLILCETGRILTSNNDALLGSYRVVGILPPHLLNAGRYYISVLFGKDQYYPLFKMDEAVAFTVENTATGRASNMSIAPGVIRPILNWNHSFMEKLFPL